MVAEDMAGVGRQMSRLAVDNDTAQASSSAIDSSLSSSSSSSSSMGNGTYRALMPSLFSNVPPTINFVLEGQKRERFYVFPP